MQQFQAIILGTDKNAYSMAKSFHEAYNVKPLALGMKRLYPTRYSRIVNVRVFENFDQQEIFMAKIIDVAEELRLQYEKLILISCGDNYTELIAKNREELKNYFIVPYIDYNLHQKLENKDNFYQICEQYNLDYPKTYVCRLENKDNFRVDFSFPVAVKAADSIEYLRLQFSGKKKAYRIDNENELKDVIKKIYDAGYKGNVIIQDFIPGDDAASFVLNTYSDQNGKVKMMCLGDVILEHCGPYEIGNYAAIISSSNRALYEKFQQFLEKINFIGFAHFDLKYDYRDKSYKLFEMNLRQGRSYYVTGSGNNMAKLVVEEYIEKKDAAITYNENEWLWLDIPKKVLFQYMNSRYLEKVKKLIKQNKYGYTLWYKKDFWPWRLLLVWKLHSINFKMFKMYFEKKDI